MRASGAVTRTALDPPTPGSPRASFSGRRPPIIRPLYTHSDKPAVTDADQQSPVLSASRTSRLAIAALVLDILSFLVGMFGVLTGVTGAVLGLLASRPIERGNRLTGRKLALAGVIISGMAVLFAITIYDWISLLHETPERETHLIGPAR
ncbi:MAG: DUF4190 domain-containing protein [Verrucomicrobiaceae bacterium]|nr:MAG: DUF4190 domain-containing protein [Verrucomicrobiaceae bacterium]